jgi:hypothetical protein
MTREEFMNTRSFFSILATFFAFSFCNVCQAQMPGGLQYATTSASISPAHAAPGSHATVTVTVHVSSGFHINSATPNDSDLIATDVSVAESHGITVGKPVYPAAKTIQAPALSQKPLSVYIGTAKIEVPVTISRSAKPGKYVLPVVISYQGCNASACYPPRTDNRAVTLLVR